MAIKVMTRVWEDGPDDRTETLVLLCLADHANDKGECYPSLGRLTDRCRLSRQGLCGVLDPLEKKGWIDRDSGGGRGNSTDYYIQLDRFEKESFENESGVGDSSKKGSSQVDSSSGPENSQADSENSQAGKKKGQVDSENSQAGKAKQSSSLDGNRHGTVKEPSSEPSESAREAETRKEDGGAREESSSYRDDYRDHPAVEAHKEFFGGVSLRQGQREKIVRVVGEEIEEWTDTLEFWQLNGYRPRSIGKQLNKFQQDSDRPTSTANAPASGKARPGAFGQYARG